MESDDDNIRNRCSSQDVDTADLDGLELELHTPADFDTVVVFIRDPENPRQYWHRSIKVVPGGNGAAYFDILTLGMGEFDVIPCPEKHLSIAVRNMKSYRERDEESIQVEGMGSAVGVAVYKGKNPLSLDQITSLVGIKYFEMRQRFLVGQN